MFGEDSIGKNFAKAYQRITSGMHGHVSTAFGTRISNFLIPETIAFMPLSEADWNHLRAPAEQEGMGLEGLIRLALQGIEEERTERESEKTRLRFEQAEVFEDYI